jgi:DNA-binding Lrp family transcriptional regulator
VAIGALDELDRSVLHALQIDGRAPFRLIAEVLGVSDQTVARRYSRLRSRHGLRVIGLRDPAAFDLAQWLVRVRATPRAAADIADGLARRDDTSWISLVSGGTQIVAGGYGDGVDSLLLDVLPRTREVLDVSADQILHVFYGGAGMPFTKGGPLTPEQIDELRDHLPAADPDSTPPAMDDLDRQLVDVLRTDARTPIEKLVATTSVSAKTVARRLNTLRSSGVLRLDVDVDLDVFERPVRTLLWLTVDAADLLAAGAALGAHPEVVFAASTTGTACLFATVSTRDRRSMFDYLSTTVTTIPGVGPVETAPVLRTVKAAALHFGARPRRPPTPTGTPAAGRPSGGLPDVADDSRSRHVG